MMEQVRLCAVWPTENWLGTSMSNTGLDDCPNMLLWCFRNRISAPRILFFFGGIVLFVLFAHYEANLTASMTSGPGRSTIKSFDDVIKGEYKVVVEDSTSMHIFMQTAQKGSELQRT